MMLITQIKLVGHVHNDPKRIITSSNSFPTGISEDEADLIIDRFAKAFTLISITTVPGEYNYRSYQSKLSRAGGSFYPQPFDHVVKSVETISSNL